MRDFKFKRELRQYCFMMIGMSIAWFTFGGFSLVDSLYYVTCGFWIAKVVKV